MRRTVDRILEGKFDYEKGSLDFSCSRIELTLFPGEEYTGSFTVISSPTKLTEGFIYSNDMRLHVITEQFSGSMQEIGYTFVSTGLEEGDVVKGEIHIISNQGEYYLPYVVSIAYNTIESSLGSVKNLFHFANLAKTNWDEAVKLFYSQRFISLFKGNDLQFKRTYLGLSKYYGNEQNMEEFLIEINKKQQIEYIVERNRVQMTDPICETEEYVAINRNGWGYTFLNVKTDVEFINLSKTTLTDNDFLGNYCRYSFTVDPSKIHNGNNFAVIEFYNAYISFSINVMVTKDVVTNPVLMKHLEQKREEMRMMEYYIAFRTKKIASGTWLAETKKIVDRMLMIDDKNIIPHLFKAQILMTEERYNEAKWILDQAENTFSEAQEFATARWAYYLYLTTLYNREENYIDEITSEVENIYAKDPSEWRIAWLLLYLSEEYTKSTSKKWIFMEQQFNAQCNSPIFYVEAVNLLIANPSLLIRLDRFELQVLMFATKRDLLTKDLISQFLYLAGKEKKCTDTMIRILTKCYEMKPDKETISVICEVLIKGERVGKEYFDWYKKGVENEVRVTRLYEYYMMSIDMEADEQIPKMVFMYFSYQSELDFVRNAYLYAKVIALREEYADIFFSYNDQINKFAINQMIQGHINKDLAVIYRFVVNEAILSKELAEKLSKLIFMHKITVDEDNVSKVVLYQSREKTEEVFLLTDHVAYVPIYGTEFTLMFEDDFSNRYMKSVEYRVEKLMVPGKIAKMLIPYVHNNLQFDVYACECSSEMAEINDENRGRYQSIMDAEEIEDEYKSNIRSKLMQYYYSHDQIRELDALLDKLDPTVMCKTERVMAIRFMVIRGLFDKALDWISEYGVEGIEPKDLVKLCSKLITRSDFVPNTYVSCIAAYAFFKGKYDEEILRYLVENYHGMTKEMRYIFNAAENFDVDIYAMCENILIQMMYTGYFIAERMSIFKKYVQGGAKTSVELAFLSQCAFEYFVKDQLMEPYVFQEMRKVLVQGEKLQTVCKLAFVKYYSENSEEIDDTIMGIIRTFLTELLDAGIFMSFFKEFMEKGMEVVNQFSDKTIIEYKTDPGKKVWIHYIIERDEDSRGEYITQEMQDMYGGVHAKYFILFFGEKLLYYITEEADGVEQLTESASISKSDISHDICESSFSLINDIVIANTLQDYDTIDNLILDFYKKEYVTKRMFRLQ